MKKLSTSNSPFSNMIVRDISHYLELGSRTVGAPGTKTRYSPHTKISKNDTEIPLGYRKDRSISFKKFYNKLRKLNGGRWNGKWSNANHELTIDNRNLIQSLSSQLPMIELERDKAERWFLSLDKRQYNSIGGIEAVAFAVCAIVTNEGETRYYPTASDNDPDFVRIADSLDLGEYELQRVIQRVRSALGLN